MGSTTTEPAAAAIQIKELGHLVLYVKDIERSRAFYRDVLGFAELPGGMPGMAAYSAGRTHHELLLIEVGAAAAPVPAGRRLGMYHFGLKIGDSDDELRAALTRLQEADVRIAGASDHVITHSLYIFDPDGNEIELYVDVAGADWRRQPELMMSRPRPLRL